MCGINGFNWKDETLVKAMNVATRHRGPDGEGVYTDESMSLGHNRLAIIDLSGRASQPMQSNDENFVITYNGELYNFKELKSELSEYSFRTEGDTEVVLAAYKKWGTKCVERFNGMFAFAIWDKSRQELYLARDHAGIKPLYYFHDGNKFVFSSEIKAILQHKIERKINSEAMQHYFRLLYVPEPFTMFDGIQKFPQAHCGVVTGDTLTLTAYGRDFTHSVGSIREVVEKAVESQLVSDKPVGVYLSGGIDSSAVLASMAKVHNKVETFSVGFTLSEGEESEKFNADFNLARRTAEYFNANHREVMVSPNEVPSLFEKAVHHMDEPISNATALAQLKLAEFAKSHVDVVLGGDGGDELFGGYERYRLSYFASLYQSLVPEFLRERVENIADSEKLDKLGTQAGIDRYMLFMFQKDEILEEVLSPGFITDSTKNFFGMRYFPTPVIDFERHFMDVDRHTWLVDESLMRADKMSMAHGLEERVPLLDREVITVAEQMSTKSKISMWKTKIAFRDAFKGHIPDFLYSEPKRGWFSPSAKWLRHKEVEVFAREILSPNYCSQTKDLFLWDNIDKMLTDHIDKRRYNLTMIWALMMFQVWAKRYNIEI
jgi:asparagine synthase (glutamine-hydrolysing)